MTEGEWLTATDPVALWAEAKRRKVGLRKLRLCVVAYCEVVRAHTTGGAHVSVAALLHVADGAGSSADHEALKPCGPLKEWPGWAVGIARHHSTAPDPLVAAMVARAHDVFGNPFRRAKFPPAWRTDTAVALAKQMYATQEFSAMPILADALQDAGCDNDDVLTHCRDPQRVHVRGCWVVDLVLERE
jgi:hypothetical protein